MISLLCQKSNSGVIKAEDKQLYDMLLQEEPHSPNKKEKPQESSIDDFSSYSDSNPLKVVDIFIF